MCFSDLNIYCKSFDLIFRFTCLSNIISIQTLVGFIHICAGTGKLSVLAFPFGVGGVQLGFDILVRFDKLSALFFR